MHLNYRKFDRIPTSQNNTLKGYNAADELLLQQIGAEEGSFGVFNDQFGCLTAHLAHQDVFVRCDLKSQAIAIEQNYRKIHGTENLVSPTFLLEEQSCFAKTALLKIPKSIALFERYLFDIHEHLANDGVVYAGFMTKYFTKNLINSCEKYFHEVEQSRAYKKARLIIMRGKKTDVPAPTLNQVSLDDMVLHQHGGIFATQKIDKATRYLLSHLKALTPQNTDAVLDLACGNGIIGIYANKNTDISQLHFLDDSELAIKSAQKNAPNTAHFHHHYHLHGFEENQFDWIMTNPPFHFEHTIDTSIAKALFIQAHHCLKPGGFLTIVSNANLGYEHLLNEQFKEVDTSKSSGAFNIFHCRK